MPTSPNQPAPALVPQGRLELRRGDGTRDGSARPAGRDERFVLASCLAVADAARARLQVARRGLGHERDLDAIRADLLAALEGCAQAIALLGAPIPPRLRDEITLYRRL
ncbi:hypothetical protein [Nocardioides sp. SR21]|uniref:hypothetical protein n=1 Tax=Nocardioides sp. SR21 TaxID=2919501 RepID=UPI001FA9C206|nr:hypothetical protein [Nocardioides sp. SR21]